MYSSTYLTNLFPPCSCLLPWAETDIKRSDRDNRNVIRWHGNIQLSVRVPTHWQPSEDLSGQWFLVRICAFLSRSVSLYIHDEKCYNYIVHLVMWFTDCCWLCLHAAIQCSFLDAPRNGQVNLRGTTVGSQALYTCFPGFTLSGVSSRTCLESGEWSDQAPTCTGKLCVS